MRANHLLSIISAAASAVAAAATASAQPAPTFVKSNADDVKDVKDVEWTATGEAGLVSTTGNSESTTITVGGNATRKDRDNKLAAAVTGTFARATVRTASDGNGNGVIDPDELSSTTATAAKNAALKLRYDRYFTPLDALYVAALGAIDQPAGKDFQGGGQIGYSRGVYKSDSQELLAELGFDVSYLKLAAGSSTTIDSLRAFAGYKGKLNTQAALEASLEGLFNANTVEFAGRKAGAFADTRLNAMIGITASLSSKLTLGASFTAKFDNFPAPLAEIGNIPFAPGFAPVADKLDTLTKVSLIVKFL